MPKQQASKTLSLTVGASSGVRPKPAHANTASAQYTNLLSWFPLYVDSVTANTPDIVGGLSGVPSRVLNQSDPTMGYVFKGDGTARKYTVPASSLLTNLLDFGRGGSSRPYVFTCWANTAINASQLVANNNPPNMYVYTYDNPNPAYPGHAFDLSRQFMEPNQGHIVAELAVDSSSAQVSDFGSKVVNDGKWHHFACYYDAPAGAGQNTSGIKGRIYVDGVLDKQSDSTTQDYFFYGIGSPGASQPLYIGTDDDGATSCFNGLFTDLRWYSSLSATALAAMQAGQPTVWELYA